MTKKALITMYITILFFSYSCLEDKGNYNYIDISDLEISGISKEKYELFAFIDTLKITPEINGLETGNSSRYSYEWKVMPRTGDDTKDSINHVISNEKDLHYLVSLPNGEYTGYYRITDNNEKTNWTATFGLTVKSLTNEGFMVLCDDNGQARLDMISNLSEKEYITAYNIWAEEDFDFGKPKNLFFNYNLNTSSSTMYVSESGTYLLDKNLMTSEALNIRWTFGATPDKVIIDGSKSTTFSYNAPRELLITNDGDLYVRSTSLAGSMYEFPINFVNGLNNFKVSPIIGMPIPDNAGGYWPFGHTILLYDNTNKEFLELRDVDEYPTKINFVNNNALFSSKTNREILFAQSTLNRETFAILKDEGENKVYIYGMNLEPDRKNTQSRYMELIGPELDKAKKFAFHPLLPYLFYSTNNKVYQYNYTQPNEPAWEVLSYNNSQIATINFFPVVGWNPYQTWERNKALLLVVGTNILDNNVDNPGKVEFYTAPALNQPLVLNEVVEGIGKIIKIELRERER